MMSMKPHQLDKFNKDNIDNLCYIQEQIVAEYLIMKKEILNKE